MSANICEAGLFDEVTLIDPYTGSIWSWCEEVLRRAEAEPERKFALLFNSIYLRVKDGDTADSMSRRYNEELRRLQK